MLFRSQRVVFHSNLDFCMESLTRIFPLRSLPFGFFMEFFTQIFPMHGLPFRLRFLYGVFHSNFPMEESPTQIFHGISHSDFFIEESLTRTFPWRSLLLEFSHGRVFHSNFPLEHLDFPLAHSNFLMGHLDFFMGHSNFLMENLDFPIESPFQIFAWSLPT